MKYPVLFFGLLLQQGLLNAQTLVHTGGTIRVTNGAHIIVNGDYLTKNNARFRTASIGFLKVKGNWINNSVTAYFRDNATKVDLSAALIEIRGNTPTNFPSLTLSSNGKIALFTNMVVGGTRGNGPMGQLRINQGIIDLQGRSLIINNPQSNAITTNAGGGIKSESNSSLGYGQIQWNIRSGSGGPVFNIPFLNASNQDISSQFIVNNIGSDPNDSGYISLATYPTADLPVPNNRPLPFGVFNTDNECDGENSMRLANRYWIVNQANYTTLPDITLSFGYSETDIKGVNDGISEAYIGGIQWNVSLNKWQYPLKGQIDAAANKFTYRAKQKFDGIWTLSDTTPYPRAQFSVVGYCQRDSIVFSDNSIEGADKIVQRQWNLGDGGVNNGRNIVHYYKNAGSFDTRLIIRSQSGCQDTAEKRIFVQTAPTAIFTLTDTCENVWVQTKSTSWPGSGFIENSIWNFDLNKPDQFGTNARYFYGAVGLPEIRLIIYNSKGCKDTMIRYPFIAPRPTAFAQYMDDCQGSPIKFTNGSNAGGGSLIGHYWNFGNGMRSNDIKETISYQEFGTFKVVYSVENSYGCKDTVRDDIEIYPRAVADFNINPTDPQMLKPIQFTNTSLYANNWEWDFGDMYYEMSENPVHEYGNHGRYEIRMVANTSYNCADTISKWLDVKSTPLYWFSNAFTPGTTEGKNDNFGIETPLRIHEYKLQVFNRWGQEIFVNEDPTAKWDGTYAGNLCPIGQYIYHATFKSPENEIMSYKGTVLLLR